MLNISPQETCPYLGLVMVLVNVVELLRHDLNK